LQIDVGNDTVFNILLILVSEKIWGMFGFILMTLKSAIMIYM